MPPIRGATHRSSRVFWSPTVAQLDRGQRAFAAKLDKSRFPVPRPAGKMLVRPACRITLWTSVEKAHRSVLIDTRCGLPFAPVGRWVLRAGHDGTNLPRCFGPPRARSFGVLPE